MRGILLLVIISIFKIQFSFAQATYKNEFGFRSDNDAYLAISQDHYYTNGLFITFRHALPLATSAKFIKKTWEAEVGQYLYNANSGDTKFIEDVDRPFAAYLYGGLKFNWFKKNESSFHSSLQIGTIGAKAYGKEVQETLHKIIGFYTIHGWEFQVNNEMGINSSFSYNNLLIRNTKNDLIFNANANIGNTFMGLGTGILYRTGNLNPIFNSAAFNSRIGANVTDTTCRKESFFYARPQLNFIAYNATIQGGMFRTNKGPVTYNPNRILFTQEFGYMYSNQRWTFNFSVIFQTKELKEQLEAQQYGSATILYRFN